MHPAKPLEAASAAVDSVCAPCAACAGAGMAGVIAVQVFFRYALNDSLFWSEELGRMLLVWLTFLGAATAYRRGAHIGVDALVSRLPTAARRTARVLAVLASLVFFAAMAVYGWRYMQLVAMQTTPALGWSMRVPVAAVPVSGAIMCLHALALLARGGRRP